MDKRIIAVTSEDALQRGIIAQRKGNSLEAEHWYRAILNEHPDHPVANHNLGVLAVSLKLMDAALPFFKCALQHDSSISEHLLSYIEASVLQGQSARARELIELATNKGAAPEALRPVVMLLEASKIDELEPLKSSKKPKLSEVRRSNAARKKRKKTKSRPADTELTELLNLYQLGIYLTAEHMAVALTEKFPNHPFAWKALGTILKQTKREEQSLRLMLKAAELDPNDAEAHFNAGIVLYELGKLERALKCQKNAIKANYEHAEAHNCMGNIFTALGKSEEALKSYQIAVQISPRFAEALYNVGRSLHACNRKAEAVDAYRRAISASPQFAEAYNNLGAVLQEQGSLDAALQNFKTAIDLKPNYVEAMYSIGNVFRGIGEFEEALTHYRRAIKIKPDFAEAHNNAGIALRHLGRRDEAFVSYNQALTHKPDLAEAHNNLGDLNAELGEVNAALENFQAAIDLKPNYADAHRHLSMYKKFKSRDKHFEQMQELVLDVHLSDYARCNISFGLAKANDDLGEFEQAYNHYKTGNSLRKKLLGYDFSNDKKLFDQLRSAQSKIKNSQLGKGGTLSSISPIFIVGMPRSGTTLVEQIISSHPEVTGAGELTFVERHGHNLAIGAAASNEESLLAFRQLYLDGLKSVCEGAAFVTDKTPHNFMYLGLIAKILPEAKIIHVRRSAAAVCWANYTQYFSTNGLGYSYSLTDVAEYYRLYTGLMETWKSETSNVIYDLDYEMLVTNQEQETRWLLEKLGLAWDDRCLSPESNKRAVSTASNMQVRRKVYQGSSERWKAYAPFLEEHYLGLLASL